MNVNRVLPLLVLPVLLLAHAASQRPASATEAMYRAQASSAEKKIRHIEANGAKAKPDTRPTELTQNEINAYLNSGAVTLPAGVSNLRVTGNDSVVTARLNVDFDKVTEGRGTRNPFMSLFSGVHDVDVTAHGVGINGEGRVHVDSVSIDGVRVPRPALEYFVDRYVKPKNPNLGIDSQFDLPSRIDTAVVGNAVLTIRQK